MLGRCPAEPGSRGPWERPRPGPRSIWGHQEHNYTLGQVVGESGAQLYPWAGGRVIRSTITPSGRWLIMSTIISMGRW